LLKYHPNAPPQFLNVDMRPKNVFTIKINLAGNALQWVEVIKPVQHPQQG
jgi:hypothetical protein